MKQYAIGLATGLIVALAAAGYSRGSGAASPRVADAPMYDIVPIKITATTNAVEIYNGMTNARIGMANRGFTKFVGLDTTHLQDGMLFVTASKP